MAMRLSGLMSGMDTESIIKELVAAKQTKVDDAKKAQTKLEWKQTAWKDLNTKLKNLQSKYLGVMRFSSAYSKRTTKVSNSSAVSVITGENAVNGVQSMAVKKLAKTGYLTGGEIEAKEGAESLTALSKISDIKNVDDTGAQKTFVGGTINLKVNGETTAIEIDEETTISDVLTKLKNAGVNANFDAKNQRFFISAKESGKDADFSLTAEDAAGNELIGALGLRTDLSKDTATMEEYRKFADYYDADKATSIAKMQSLVDGAVSSKANDYLAQYKSLAASLEGKDVTLDDIRDKYKDTVLDSADSYSKQIEEKNAKLAELTPQLDNETLTEDDKKVLQERIDTLNEEVSTLSEQKIAAQLQEIEKNVTVTADTAEDGTVTYSVKAKDALKDEVGDYYYQKATYAHSVMENPSVLGDATATKVSGQDAEITLNGATFTSKTNVFEINGLTFTALSETKEGEEVTITTEDDVDGIYDMVKNFLKEYNSLVNEMDKLYNADSAKGYEPLTDDEKDAMSDTEVEKYETKIKDALLRRDSNLSTINSALKEIMSGGVEVNGKTMYLSNFGINTLGYFEAPDNEKNAYHIDGDADDANTSGNADKLKSMISNDPDTVISFFSSLSKSLYSKMSDLSKSVEGYRSYGNFYDDKKMKSDYDDYTSKISDLEDKLNDYEDKWYSKFSKMETAMAKLQSNASAVTSLLGGGS